MKKFVIIINIAMFFIWFTYMMAGFIGFTDNLWGIVALACLLFQCGAVMYNAAKN